MANRYFSQYLLNKGVLAPENAGEMLAKSLHVTPDLSVLALEKGLINSEQALELAESAGVPMPGNYIRFRSRCI